MCFSISHLAAESEPRWKQHSLSFLIRMAYRNCNILIRVKNTWGDRWKVEKNALNQVSHESLRSVFVNHFCFVYMGCFFFPLNILLRKKWAFWSHHLSTWIPTLLSKEVLAAILWLMCRLEFRNEYFKNIRNFAVQESGEWGVWVSS